MSRNFELLRRTEGRAQVISPRNGQPVRPQPPTPQSPPPLPSESDWTHVFVVLRIYWVWWAGFALAALVTAAIVTALMKPVYVPTATIEVDPPGAELFALNNGGDGGDSGEYLGTQTQVLRSDEVALVVINKLNLNENPEFGGTGADAAIPAAGAEQTRVPRDSPILSDFRSRLHVTRDSSSRLITVSFEAHDPRLAALITNTLIDLFIETTYQKRHEAILTSSQWLTKQLDEIRTRMERSNRELEEFQNQTGIAAVGEDQNTVGQRLTELNRQLALAQAERVQYEAFTQAVHPGDSSALPQASADPVMQDMAKKLADARTQLVQALTIYGRKNPHVEELQNQVDEEQRQIRQRQKTIVSNLKSSYAAASVRERLLQRQIDSGNKELKQMARYFALKKEAQASTDLYNSLYAKVKEAGIAAESKSSNIRVVDQARVLRHPTRPSWPVNILAGLAAGLIGGLTVALVRNSIDRTVRTPTDVKECTGVAAVSVVPLIGSSNLISRLRGPRQTDKFLLERPDSPESEALFGLYTSLRFSRPGGPPHAILIASPFAGEGKTTLAVNLALALARHGPTCLIDADLRNAGISRTFGVLHEAGLADVLATGAQNFENSLVPLSDLGNLVILPAGKRPTHASELLGSAQASELLQSLRAKFDFVVIDSPPIVPFADARPLTTLVEGIVLVGRAGATTKPALVRALELLQESPDSAPVVEIVLNGADFTAAYYGHYSSQRPQPY